MTMTMAIIMTMSVKVIYVVIFSNLATLLRIHDKLKKTQIRRLKRATFLKLLSAKAQAAFVSNLGIIPVLDARWKV